MQDIVRQEGGGSQSSALRAYSRLLVDTVPHGHKAEYRFYEYLDGDPKRVGTLPGQIKAFYVDGKLSPEKRVPFDDLPTLAMQKLFVELTGRSAESMRLRLRE